MTRWTTPRPEHAGAYAYVEQLPNDAPPTKIEMAVFNMGSTWQYWTVAGWATLTSRVCICERPEE